MEYWKSHLKENENIWDASGIREEPMTSLLCELCNKNERYHMCPESNNQHLCLTCFNKLHFGINAPRTGKSMVYNKCVFCNIVYATNAKGSVCDECSIIVIWKSGMHFLAGVNRVSALIRENKLDSKLRNENYCIENLGSRATKVIMDAIDSSTLLSKR
jgi:hypothetical protein